MRTPNRTFHDAAILLLVLVVGCSDEETAQIYQWSTSLSADARNGERLIAGTSLNNMWGLHEGNPPTTESNLARFDGSRWVAVEVPELLGPPDSVSGFVDNLANTIEVAGPDSVWIAGGALVSGEIFIWRVYADGRLEDHSGDIISPMRRTSLSLEAGHGGVFGLFEGGEPTLHRVDASGRFVPVPGGPTSGSQILGVVGPDEAYVMQSSTNASPAIVHHYRNGEWNTVDFTFDEQTVQLTAASATDVWIWASDGGGGTGVHGDGAAWSTFSTTDWPEGLEAMIPIALGDDRLAIVARGDGGRKGTSVVRLDADSRVTSTASMSSKSPSTSRGYHSFAVLDDNTVVGETEAMGQWMVFQVSP